MLGIEIVVGKGFEFGCYSRLRVRLMHLRTRLRYKDWVRPAQVAVAMSLALIQVTDADASDVIDTAAMMRDLEENIVRDRNYA